MNSQHITEVDFDSFSAEELWEKSKQADGFEKLVYLIESSNRDCSEAEEEISLISEKDVKRLTKDNLNEFVKYIFSNELKYTLYIRGCLYLDSSYGFKKNLKKAIEYYEQSDTRASKTNIGLMYFYGHEVKRDYKKAMEYFEESNTKWALCYIGLMYQFSLGVKRDYEKARYYYQRSNVPTANLRLGGLYQHGLGGCVDYMKAKECYELCISTEIEGFWKRKGHIYLAILYYFGFGVEKNREMAEYHCKAANYSMYKLPFRYWFHKFFGI